MLAEKDIELLKAARVGDYVVLEDGRHVKCIEDKAGLCSKHQTVSAACDECPFSEPFDCAARCADECIDRDCAFALIEGDIAINQVAYNPATHVVVSRETAKIALHYCEYQSGDYATVSELRAALEDK